MEVKQELVPVSSSLVQKLDIPECLWPEEEYREGHLARSNPCAGSDGGEGLARVIANDCVHGCERRRAQRDNDNPTLRIPSAATSARGAAPAAADGESQVLAGERRRCDCSFF